MKKYLFKDTHNGYQNTYHPFEVCESISQEQAEKMMLKIQPAAKKIGACVEHLLEALDKQNIKFKQYKSVYHKPEENSQRTCFGEPTTDPLPECMYTWDIIEGISGNY